jgi:hypothetical protein
MRTYKSIEKKSVILGMPVMDLMLLLSSLVGLVMLGSIVSLFTVVSKYYYLGSLGLVILGYGILRYANRYGHPAYLPAALSFHFKQARQITPFQPTNAHGKDQ